MSEKAATKPEWMTEAVREPAIVRITKQVVVAELERGENGEPLHEAAFAAIAHDFFTAKPHQDNSYYEYEDDGALVSLNVTLGKVIR